MGAGIICAPALMELEGRQRTALLVSDSTDVTKLSHSDVLLAPYHHLPLCHPVPHSRCSCVGRLGERQHLYALPPNLCHSLAEQWNGASCSV